MRLVPLHAFRPHYFAKVPNVVEVPTAALRRYHEFHVHLDTAPVICHTDVKRLMNVGQKVNEKFERIGRRCEQSHGHQGTSTRLRTNRLRLRLLIPEAATRSLRQLPHCKSLCCHGSRHSHGHNQRCSCHSRLESGTAWKCPAR